MTSLLSVEALPIAFASAPPSAVAVNRIALRVERGETLAVVGESGCGKSITAMAIMGLLPRGEAEVVEGHIRFRGEDLARASEARMREVRGGEIGMIFQEPMTALNPVLTVGLQIAEVLREHRAIGRADAAAAAVRLLARVGIPAPELRALDYPHRLSGGMRQRVMIAMAIACEPALLIADEPTTALDVTVQAQILDLLRELQQERGMGIMIITHDLGVVADTAHRVVVMYAGCKVEESDVHALFRRPLHPYTVGLLRALPGLPADDERTVPRLHEIAGTVPHILGREPGCNFANRCPRAQERCRHEVPQLRELEDRHFVACFFAGEGETA